MNPIASVSYLLIHKPEGKQKGDLQIIGLLTLLLLRCCDGEHLRYGVFRPHCFVATGKLNIFDAHGT